MIGINPDDFDGGEKLGDEMEDQDSVKVGKQHRATPSAEMETRSALSATPPESITLNELKVGQFFFFRYGKFGKRVGRQEDAARVLKFVGCSETGAFRVLHNGQFSVCLNSNAPILLAR